MKIGYACLIAGSDAFKYRTCTLKTASEDHLRTIIEHNLSILEKMIDYNIKNNIRLFRISSDLIPFASHEINQIKWWVEYETLFSRIGEKIRAHSLRISMHPGQYTVINSPDVGVVKRSIEELTAHVRVLDALGVDEKNKIILHIGGVYGDKPAAIERFKATYLLLDGSIKKRLVIENDDRNFTISEVLSIGEALGIPVVYDNLHHKINPCKDCGLCGERGTDFNEAYEAIDAYWIQQCRTTWQEMDGTQKIHYSQQDKDKRPGAHSTTIFIDDFLRFYHQIQSDPSNDLDIMLEVKDKNLSAIKCILCLGPSSKEDAVLFQQLLESEWAKYKYLVLEKSQKNYTEIRKIFANSNRETPIESRARTFYTCLENALALDEHKGDVLNAASHVWGYFSSFVTEKDKTKWLEALDLYKKDRITKLKLKKILYQHAQKNMQMYLLNSYYWML